MTDKPAYFRSGDEADSALDTQIKESSERTWVPRVYIKDPTPPESPGTKFIFVDGNQHPGGYNTPYAFEEHQLQLNGSWRNWFTCIEGLPHPETGRPMACPICRSTKIPPDKKSPYLAHAYTVINTTPYPNKDRTKIMNAEGNELTLLVAKQTFANVIKRRRIREKPNGGLRGLVAYFIRHVKQGAGTGNEISWEERIELGEDVQPLDYHVILAPKTPEQILKKLIMSGLGEGTMDYNQVVPQGGQAPQGGTGGYRQAPPNDDDIPF